MPDDQINNAPHDASEDVRGDTTAAAVVNGTRPDLTPGGGGLGGQAAAEADPQASAATGAATPNSPIGAGVRGGTVPTDAEEDATAEHLRSQ